MIRCVIITGLDKATYIFTDIWAIHNALWNVSLTDTVALQAITVQVDVPLN